MPEPWFPIYKRQREAGNMTDAMLATALSLGRITQPEYDILIAIPLGG
jgi:hypothetical protein